MDLEAALRAHDFRITHARRVVWEVLTAAGRHLSAQEVTSGVHAVDPSINESSVYRTLTMFAAVGLVRESRLDEVATWEPFHDDAEIHLMCSSCGDVIHHDTDHVRQLRQALARDIGFVPTEIDVRVTGRCADCTRGARQQPPQ